MKVLIYTLLTCRLHLLTSHLKRKVAKLERFVEIAKCFAKSLLFKALPHENSRKKTNIFKNVEKS